MSKAGARIRVATRKRQVGLPVFWTQRALSDLEAIGDYIARDDAVAAERWVTTLIATAAKAALLPLAGRRVPEIARDDIRERIVKSYRVVYRITAKRFEVLTVFEGHRRFPDDVEAADP